MEEKGTEWWEWLPGAATVCSIVTCYGTLAVVGVLSVMGVGIALHEGEWAGVISAFAMIAGFAALVAATVWDWRAKKSRRDG